MKYSRILKKIYKNENLINNLSGLFGMRFKNDWIGRLYVIINPNLIDNKFDTNSQIYEYGVNGLNNNTYVERWVMGKMNIASNFIRTNNLFDLLTYKIKRLDDYDNYLFIIQPITLDDCLKYTKRFVILLFILLIISILLIILLP